MVEVVVLESRQELKEAQLGKVMGVATMADYLGGRK